MKRLQLYIFQLYLAAIIIGLGAPNATYSATDDTAKHNTSKKSADSIQQLQQLQGKIAETQNSLHNTDRQQSRLQKQLQASELNLAASHRKRRKLETNRDSLQRELNELKQQKSAIKQRSKSQVQRLADEITAGYQLGQQEPLKLLFNIEDPRELSRMLTYYDYFITARTQELDKYRNALAEIDTIGKNIELKRAKLSEKHTELELEQQRLLKKGKQRQQLLAKLQKQYKNKSLHLNTLKGEERRLQSVIEALQQEARQVRPGTPFAKQRGTLPWPVKGKLVSSFGDKRTSSLRWSGWLLRVNEGSTVRVVHAGTIVFSDYLRGHGLLVIVDHGDNYLSLYAHNQTLTRGIGEHVKRGDTIARVGNSGGIQQSALYFEIRYQGKAIDPKLWLRQRA